LQHIAGAGVVAGFIEHVAGMHRLRVGKGPAHHEIPRGCSREQAVKGRRLLRRHAVDCDQVKEPAIGPRHRAELRLAHSGGASDDTLEYRLEIGR